MISLATFSALAAAAGGRPIEASGGHELWRECRVHGLRLAYQVAIDPLSNWYVSACSCGHQRSTWSNVYTLADARFIHLARVAGEVDRSSHRDLWSRYVELRSDIFRLYVYYKDGMLRPRTGTWSPTMPRSECWS